MKKYMQSTQTMQSNYSFELNYNYRDTMIAEYDNFLYVMSFYNGFHQFFMPIGLGDPINAIYKLSGYLDTFNENFQIHKLTLLQCDLIEALFPEKYSFELAREDEEYIYLTNSLFSLNGYSLRAKRNQVNNITKQKSWSFNPITLENINECKKLAEIWNQYKSIDEINNTVEIDKQSLLNALNDFFILKLEGGILMVEQKAMAFAIGCPLNSDVYISLFIRADRTLRGVYQLVFREFIREYAINYKYFNYLDDAGDPGLRHAKLSYHPIILNEVYTASLKI